MKKFIYVLLVLCSTIFIASCSKEEAEQDASVSENDYIYTPTFEELVGCTGEDLIHNETLYTYKSMVLNSEYTLLEVNGSSAIEHDISVRIVYETDGIVSDIWITKRDSHDGLEDFDTSRFYVDTRTSTLYRLDNYSLWTQEQVTRSSVYKTALGTNNTVNDFHEGSGYTLIVSGSTPMLGVSSFDEWIKYILSEYGISDASYSYHASYGSIDKQFNRIDANITPASTGVMNDNEVTITSMDAYVLLMEADSMSTMTIPDYVIAAASAKESIEEDVEDELGEFNPSVPLCTSLFGIDANLDDVREYLTTHDLGGDIVQVISELITFMSYDSLMSYDYTVSEDARSAYDIIMSWVYDRDPELRNNEPVESEEDDSNSSTSNEPL